MNVSPQAKSDVVSFECFVEVSKVLRIAIGCALQIKGVATVHGVMGHNQPRLDRPLLGIFLPVVLLDELLDIHVIVEWITIGVLIGEGLIDVFLWVIRYDLYSSEVHRVEVVVVRFPIGREKRFSEQVVRAVLGVVVARTQHERHN